VSFTLSEETKSQADMIFFISLSQRLREQGRDLKWVCRELELQVSVNTDFKYLSFQRKVD
jgi:hypothetical protein